MDVSGNVQVPASEGEAGDALLRHVRAVHVA